jgi:hypothetical protein
VVHSQASVHQDTIMVTAFPWAKLWEKREGLKEQVYEVLLSIEPHLVL